MSQTNKRLSDVTKKQTTDRASKLASSFLPDLDERDALPIPAASLPLAAPVSPLAEVIEQGENDFAEGRGVIMNIDELKQATAPAPPAKSISGGLDKPRERTRRTAPVIDLAEAVGQPLPEGVRCTRMIMLSDEHHDMLRELHFIFKKPMTSILYNLLEPAHQALLRQKTKSE